MAKKRKGYKTGKEEIKIVCDVDDTLKAQNKDDLERIKDIT